MTLPSSRPHRAATVARLAARALLLGLLALAGLSAAPAQAALPVTFSSLSAGTTLSSQYAADGVTFQDPTGTSGLPIVSAAAAGSLDGKVATPTCPGCEFDARETWVALSTLAQSATLHLGIVDSGGSANVTVQALDTNQSVIATTTVAATSTTFRTTATLTAPGGSTGIAFLRVKVPNGFTFGIDDLDYTATGGGPDFAVVPSAEQITIREGTTVGVPISLLRLNGSTGGIIVNNTTIPDGLTITPPLVPVTGTSATVTVAAALGARTSNGLVRLQGTPTGATAGSTSRFGSFSVTVEPSFKLAPDLADGSVTPCTPRMRNLSVQRATNGFSGTVTLTAEASDGYSVTLDRATLTNSAGDTATQLVGLTISATRPDPPATGTVTIHGTAPGASDQTATLPITRAAATISSFTPVGGRTPWNRSTGTEVTINGTGLCAGSHVQFGSSVADVAATSAAADGTSLRASIPRLGITGPITVVTPTSTATSADSLMVASPRATQGFKFENYHHPGVDLAAITALYGEAQTHLSIDPCNPLPGIIPPICPIPTPIPNPLTAIYIGISNAALSTNASCFGISVTSQHIPTGVVSISSFPPAGARTDWELSGTSSPSPALAERIREWHTAQLSSEWLGYWIDHAAANVSNSGRGSLATLESELGAGRHPIVSLRDTSGAGHAVVAHNVRPGPNPGDYDVDVYDSNAPLTTAEFTDPALHQSRVDNSVIHVEASGHWTFPGQFAHVWSGGSDNMVVVPLSVLGAHPTIPTDPHGIVQLLVPLASGVSSTVAQVEDASGKKLLGADGQLNPDPGARPANATLTPTITGDGSQPMYSFKAGTATTLTLQGTGDGTTGAATLGPDFATRVTGLQTSKGGDDQLQVNPGRGSLAIDAGKGGSIDGTIAKQVGPGDGDTAVHFQLGGADAGTHRATLDGLAFTYANGAGGPVTLRTTITSSSGLGGPGDLVLPTLVVPAGGKVGVFPKAWSKLASDGVRVTVRDRSGQVVQQRTVASRAPRWASAARLTVAKGGLTARHIKVGARFAGVPKGATVVVGVHVRVGKKIVATQQQTLKPELAKGRRTLDFTVDLPKGRSTVYGTATVVSGTRASAARASRKITVR